MYYLLSWSELLPYLYIYIYVYISGKQFVVSIDSLNASFARKDPSYLELYIFFWSNLELYS